MPYSGYEDVTEWYENLWRSNKKHDFSNEIRSLALKEVDEEHIRGLSHALQFEFIRHEKYQELIELIEKQVAANPANSLNRIILAESYLYYLEDTKLALQKIDLAIPVAQKAEKFIRNALQVRARILRKLEDNVGLSDCMREIMLIESKNPNLDAVKEDDFLRQLPIDAISKELLDEFSIHMTKK